MTRIVRMSYASAGVGGLFPTGYMQILKDPPLGRQSGGRMHS